MLVGRAFLLPLGSILLGRQYKSCDRETRLPVQQSLGQFSSPLEELDAVRFFLAAGGWSHAAGSSLALALVIVSCVPSGASGRMTHRHTFPSSPSRHLTASAPPLPPVHPRLFPRCGLQSCSGPRSTCRPTSWNRFRESERTYCNVSPAVCIFIILTVGLSQATAMCTHYM